MKWMFVTVCALFCSSVFSQTPQQEINSEVWKPFLSSFNNRDTRAFMDVHSKQVVRAPRDSKVVWNWDEYFQAQERGDKNEKASRNKRELELRFTERLANKDLAVEVGVYKTTYIQQNGSRKSYYGRFHVVLRKENGIWKILVDTDSTEGNTITEEHFLAGQPLE
jgi:ketosteroid isomerase-like protein